MRDLARVQYTFFLFEDGNMKNFLWKAIEKVNIYLSTSMVSGEKYKKSKEVEEKKNNFNGGKE